MLTIPHILDTPHFYDAPLGYKWNDDIFFECEDVENKKLFESFKKLNHKAAIGLAASFAEWIYWRLHKKGDLEQLLQSIEQLWAGIIDWRYIVDWVFEMDYDKIDAVNGVKQLTIESIQETRRYYLNGRYYIATQLESQAMLARRIAPDKKMFDNWLDDVLNRAIPLFPKTYDPYAIPTVYSLDRKPYYDAFVELPIPREFFFISEFDYEKADINKLLNNLLSGLSYQDNKYITSPEIMIEKGFKGTPYKYESTSH